MLGKPMKIANHRCQFCQGEAIYAPLEKMSKYGIEIFFCYPCQAEYCFYHYNIGVVVKDISISLYTRIKNEMYRWTFFRWQEGLSRHTLWWVKNPGIPGVVPNEGLKCLFSSTEKMTFLTPQNVNNKISVWLKYL